MSLCECGCEGLASVRFISGHNFRGSNRGERNPAWKGESAGYMAIHNWVRRHKAKTGACEECGERRWTDWANINHEYRRELDDYRELCRPCHRVFDTHGAPTIEAQLRKALA